MQFIQGPFTWRKGLALLGLTLAGVATTAYTGAYYFFSQMAGIAPRIGIVGQLSPSSQCELTLLLGLLTLLGALILAIHGVRTVSAWNRRSSLVRCFSFCVGVLLTSSAITTVMSLTQSKQCSLGQRPYWNQTAFDATALALFLPALLAVALRNRPGWNVVTARKAVAVTVFGLAGMVVGPGLTAMAQENLTRSAIGSLALERPLTRDVHLEKTVVTFHPQMPPLQAKWTSIGGWSKAEVDAAELLWKNRLGEALELAIKDRSSLLSARAALYTCALNAPTPQSGAALGEFADAKKFSVSNQSTLDALRLGLIRHGLPDPKAGTPLTKSVAFETRDAQPSAQIRGRIRVLGSNETCHLRLVRVNRDSTPELTYERTARIARATRTFDFPWYLAMATMYSVCQPKEGQFNFTRLDSGRYLVQLDLPSNRQVVSCTAIPVVELTSGQTLDLGQLEVSVR